MAVFRVWLYDWQEWAQRREITGFLAVLWLYGGSDYRVGEGRRGALMSVDDAMVGTGV